MIGLLPAAGEASRMNGLPKWLLPIPRGCLLTFHSQQMRELVERERIYIGVNWNNVDLVGSYVRTEIPYIADLCETMNQTVLGARKQYSDNPSILFGMPDTYFEDAQAYNKLAAALNAGADLAVGLFYTRPEQRSKLGMCRLVDEHITNVIDKPFPPCLEWAWGVLGWRPVFWDCIKPEEPHVGYAIPRAITAGLDVRAVKMEGQYFDCGTSQEYFECIRHITG